MNQYVTGDTASACPAAENSLSNAPNSHNFDFVFTVLLHTGFLIAKIENRDLYVLHIQ